MSGDQRDRYPPAVDQERRQCPNCGATVDRSGRFCGACGTRQPTGGTRATGDTESGRRGRAGRSDRGSRQYDRGGQPERTRTAGPGSDTGMAAIAHLLALFLGILGPLVLYVLTDDPFVKENAAQATNWQLTMVACSVVGVVGILYGISSATFDVIVLAVLALFVLGAVNVLVVIVSAMKASNGEAWAVPLTPEVL